MELIIAIIIGMMFYSPAYALRPEATVSASINDIVNAVRIDRPGLCFVHSVILVGLLERLGYRAVMMGLFNSDGDMYHAYVATEDFGEIDIFAENNPTPDKIGYGSMIQNIYYDKVKHSFTGQVDKAMERLVFMLIKRRLDEIEFALADENYDFIYEALLDIEYLVHMCDTPLKMTLEDKILNKTVPFGAYLKRNGEGTDRVQGAYDRLKVAVEECYRNWIGYRPRNINRLFNQAA